jgi:hypothetical protein
VIADALSTSLDACTLNNALNIVQLAVLLALLKWGPRRRRAGPPAD